MNKSKINPKLKDGTLNLHADNERDFTCDFSAPELQATVTQFLSCDEKLRDKLDLQCLREDIARACDEVNAGNMRLPERIALAQAHTLDALFHRLAQRACNNFGAHWFEPYMKLALRAQAQSARTLETLAALKNPTVFAKQLNVANQQVVNNGSPPLGATPAKPPELAEPLPIVPLAKSEISTREDERMDR